jgi:hypothetical protein
MYLDRFAPDVTASEQAAAAALSGPEADEMVLLLRKLLGLGGTT